MAGPRGGHTEVSPPGVGAGVAASLLLLAACVQHAERDEIPAPVTQTSPAPTQAQDAVHPAAAASAADTVPAPIATGDAAATAGSGGNPPQLPAEPRAPVPHYAPRFAAKSASYDRSGPAYSQLQSARNALGGFPADALGTIDWVEALERGLIAPRASLDGSGSMRSLDNDIVMRNTREMPWVRFPHRQHTAWLACSNCHPKPFREAKGGNTVTMDSIMRGEHCGMCHDRVAFSIFACERCHSIPHPGSPAAWW